MSKRSVHRIVDGIISYHKMLDVVLEFFTRRSIHCRYRSTFFMWEMYSSWRRKQGCSSNLFVSGLAMLVPSFDTNGGSCIRGYSILNVICIGA